MGRGGGSEEDIGIGIRMKSLWKGDVKIVLKTMFIDEKLSINVFLA